MHPQPVAKTIGGVEFVDPYPQLHDDTSEALAWQWEQDALAQRAVAASPNFAPVRDRLLKLRPGGQLHVAPLKAGGLWFSVGEHEGSAALLVQDELSGPARIIGTARDLAARNGAKTVSMMHFSPSPGGAYIGAGILIDGDTSGPWVIYEVASGRLLFATSPAPHLHSRLGWLPDESGFWMGVRTPDGGHRQQFHPVAPGTPRRPDAVIDSAMVDPGHAVLTAQVSPDGRRAVLVSEPHEHVAVVLLDLETLESRRFAPEGWTGECDGTWLDARTYVARVSENGARGRVVAIPVETSRDLGSWRQIVPEGEGFMNWAGVVGGRLYVGDTVDVSQRIRVFDLDGHLMETLPLAGPWSTPSQLISRSIRPTEAFAFTHATLTQSAALMAHDPGTGELARVHAPANELKEVTVERRFALSHDGARIPYFVVRRSNMDTSQPQPALVHAYGGFNISLLPNFPAQFAPFIEAGGVFVQACLRGGAEYGAAWHDAGRLQHKWNTFHDLAAVAEALIDDGVSTPDRMAFEGHSNGGMLAAAATVHQPHLWRATAPIAPLMDMMEPFPDTPDTVMITSVFHEDYGDVSDPQMAKTVFSWSPYHNIEEGVAYPAVFQIFGENDPGCRPFHGRKFTARLRDADVGGRPIHLRVWRDTGHVVFDPVLAAAYTAEWLSFLMDQVGLSYLPAKQTEAAE